MGRVAVIAGQRYTLYDAEYVEQRLVDAAETLKRLPVPRNGRPTGHVSNWPEVLQSFWEMWNALDSSERQEREAEINYTPVKATNAAIARLDEVLEWLWHLDQRERALIMARALNTSWRKLSRWRGGSHEWLRTVEYPRILDKLTAKLNTVDNTCQF